MTPLEVLLREKLPDSPELAAAIVGACQMALADSDAYEDLCEAVGEDAGGALWNALGKDSI